ncbi:hypothetical protein Pisl_1467 [Pyrobaculum islandicum DSM 4184]|uniref:Nucleotide-diphospho-sugar transferase domain-containing protein n=1 Tax=Pyrobaculum islandicum (strain DSM 4184 / JCM 9189 / GEO3) TaxID=384616 RepID=A1RUJ1_PYRIL|nr:hypothetical protein [Pyrobaculum islandicum]ABL88623.1 hypothetical protein Pisl_1467 [Pyrobaculum islandicum DSM 4184]
MILATYLPLFRIHELEIFDRNYREIKPDEVAICIDYYYTERQMPIVEMYTSRYSPHLILGNWRNRTSCLLRLVDYIQRRGGDGLIVDSDVYIPNFHQLDKALDLPFYHIAEGPWAGPRVRCEKRGQLEVCYWRVRALWARTMQVFAGPKQAIRYRERLNLDVEPILKTIEAMDPLYAAPLADETTLGIVYDKAGIREVPFVVAAKHDRHRSDPKSHSYLLYRELRAKALWRLFKEMGYLVPAVRYLLSSIFYSLRTI